MEKKETRGAKKGRPKPLGSGRKNAPPEFKTISKSVSLQKWAWDRLEEMAEQQGTTKNKIISNLVEIFLKK